MTGKICFECKLYKFFIKSFIILSRNVFVLSYKATLVCIYYFQNIRNINFNTISIFTFRICLHFLQADLFN